jgi:hypothetical protein
MLAAEMRALGDFSERQKVFKEAQARAKQRKQYEVKRQKEFQKRIEDRKKKKKK